MRCWTRNFPHDTFILMNNQTIQLAMANFTHCFVRKEDLAEAQRVLLCKITFILGFYRPIRTWNLIDSFSPSSPDDSWCCVNCVFRNQVRRHRSFCPCLKVLMIGELIILYIHLSYEIHAVECDEATQMVTFDNRKINRDRNSVISVNGIRVQMFPINDVFENAQTLICVSY